MHEGEMLAGDQQTAVGRVSDSQYADDGARNASARSYRTSCFGVMRRARTTAAAVYPTRTSPATDADSSFPSSPIEGPSWNSALVAPKGIQRGAEPATSLRRWALRRAGRLDEPEEGLLQVRRPLETVQHDAVLGRELPDLLGCRVHGQPLVGRTVPVAGRIQGRAEPVRVRRADPGADARLGAQRVQGRGCLLYTS